MNELWNQVCMPKINLCLMGWWFLNKHLGVQDIALSQWVIAILSSPLLSLSCIENICNDLFLFREELYVLGLNMRLNDNTAFALLSCWLPPLPVLQAPHTVQHNGFIKAPLHACSSVYLCPALALTAHLSDEPIRDGVHRPALRVTSHDDTEPQGHSTGVPVFHLSTV